MERGGPNPFGLDELSSSFIYSYFCSLALAFSVVDAVVVVVVLSTTQHNTHTHTVAPIQLT